jgi:hypothetical protein
MREGCKQCRADLTSIMPAKALHQVADPVLRLNECFAELLLHVSHYLGPATGSSKFAVFGDRDHITMFFKLTCCSQEALR